MPIQVTYEQMLALRAEANSKIYATDNGGNWQLDSSDADGKALQTTLEKQVAAEGGMIENPALAGFESVVLPNCNKPIEKVEVRFKTHDWSDVTDWDQRTHGDCCAYLAGGYLKHPVDGSWLNATGAGMIATYGSPTVEDPENPGQQIANPNFLNPNYLFGAWGHRLEAVYDDVAYKWMSADGETRYAWLDTSVSPSVWKNDAGTPVVHYDPTPQEWIRNDNSAVVTSSLWRILPYELTKLQINMVKTTVDSTALFDGRLHYQVYMDLAAGVAGAGYPAGNYKVADWNYGTLAELAAGADAVPYIEPITRASHDGPIMILTYDYKNATKTPVIDSAFNMHLDVLLSENAPVTNTHSAYATFICMKIASF